MSLKRLDQLYDAICGDLEETEVLADFILAHHQGTSLLELACGSGDLSLILAQSIEQVTGVDLSEQMIEQAQKKDQDSTVRFLVGDMRSDPVDRRFDTIVCVGDSLNYLLSQDDLQKFVENCVRHQPETILLDCHHPHRLEEFNTMFLEEGIAEEVGYQWTIATQGDRLYHHFTFFSEPVEEESVIQWVFDPEILELMFEQAGYSISLDLEMMNRAPLEKNYYVLKRSV